MWLRNAEITQKRFKALAVLGNIDRLTAAAEDLYTQFVERRRQVNRGLPTELHDDRRHLASPIVALFVTQNLVHALRIQWLEVEAVRRVEIGRNRFGIRV